MLNDGGAGIREGVEKKGGIRPYPPKNPRPGAPKPTNPPVPETSYLSYSGPETCCIKCGHNGASTGYREAIDLKPERIARQCQECGYFWYESPLDAGGNAEKEA